MSQKSEETRSVQGYSMFDDIEDRNLRMRNQGAILRNIAVSSRSRCGKKLKPAGMAMLMSYFSNIKEADKGTVMTQFEKHCRADGFELSTGA